MSDSAPPLGSLSENETASESPPPPPSEDDAPPPSPSSNSSSPPPSPSSDSTSKSPPSSSGSSPPPSTPPPPDESSAPPPLPLPSSKSPPPEDDSSSEAPPSPPPASDDSPSPPPPPPNDPDSQLPPSPTSHPSNDSSPSSPLPSDSPIAAPPPPSNHPTSPLPPSPSPPGQLLTPSNPETPVNTPTSPLPPPPPPGSLPGPSKPESSPALQTPPRPSPSTPIASSPSESSSDITTTSKHTSSNNSSKPNGSLGNGTAIGMGIAVALIVAAVAYCCLKKKKRRTDTMLDVYKPPPSFSVGSGGYYRQENSVGHSGGSYSYYGTGPPPSTSHGPAHDSFRGHGGYQQGPPDPGAKSWFSYEELMEITNAFSRENLIGEGGFGCVYKGMLLDGRQVAVKQLKAGSGQGEREFRAEVEIISRVHHRHLVSLVGYCIAEYHRLLVYEFVPNDTLEHHLHGRELPVMEWPKRMKISIGSARGLAYLHEDCHPRIIHRDIKSANILLDDAWEAQVADFGLAKLSNDTHTHVSTRVMGTFGYLAPEYASSGKLTDRSDVFSFGVVLLELITGRKPVDPSQPLGDESLVEWARPLLVHALETGEFEQLVDPRLDNNFAKGEMLRMIEVAAACVRHSAPKRPRMVQVLRALDNEGQMPDLSNGVKFGQSTVFDSGQYSADIRNFRQMAFGSGGGDYSSDFGYSGEQERRGSVHSGEYERRASSYSGEYERRSPAHGGEFHGRGIPPRPPNPWRPGEANAGEYSRDAEARAMSRRGSDRSSPRTPPRPGETSFREHSNESDTRAMYPRGNDRADRSYRYHGRGFE